MRCYVGRKVGRYPPSRLPPTPGRRFDRGAGFGGDKNLAYLNKFIDTERCRLDLGGSSNIFHDSQLL